MAFQKRFDNGFVDVSSFLLEEDLVVDIGLRQGLVFHSGVDWNLSDVFSGLDKDWAFSTYNFFPSDEVLKSSGVYVSLGDGFRRDVSNSKYLDFGRSVEDSLNGMLFEDFFESEFYDYSRSFKLYEGGVSSIKMPRKVLRTGDRSGVVLKVYPDKVCADFFRNVFGVRPIGLRSALNVETESLSGSASFVLPNSYDFISKRIGSSNVLDYLPADLKRMSMFDKARK